MKEKLLGRKLIELGRSEGEVLVMSRRMIEMGRAVVNRFSFAEEGEISETVTPDGERILEMILALPGHKLMTLSMRVVADGPVDMSVTYHLPDDTTFEDVDFGTVRFACLDMEPGEAATELEFTTKRVEDGGLWSVHMFQIKTAPVLSVKNLHSPWGVVH